MRVNVRHDATVHVVIKCGYSFHGDPCNDSIIPITHLDAHLAVMSVMHGKVSGYDSGIRVTQSWELANPERDILKKGELCTCKECLEGKHDEPYSEKPKYGWSPA